MTLLAGLRILHKRGPKIKRKISGTLHESASTINPEPSHRRNHNLFGIAWPTSAALKKRYFANDSVVSPNRPVRPPRTYTTLNKGFRDVNKALLYGFRTMHDHNPLNAKGKDCGDAGGDGTLKPLCFGEIYSKQTSRVVNAKESDA
uniref:Uncharacterized protein n=1 Tax=Anopheles atroparvus TaxID=41427 RepID=A0AAG5DDZ5_ANOAO